MTPEALISSYLLTVPAYSSLCWAHWEWKGGCRQSLPSRSWKGGWEADFPLPVVSDPKAALFSSVILEFQESHALKKPK